MEPGQAMLDLSDAAVSVGRRIKGLDGEQRRAQRRQKLLDAALERFAVDGYANTAIEQICQEAEVSTRSYYELFDSKEACYLALLSQITDRLVAGVVDSLRDAPADESEATSRLLAAFAHSLIDDPRLAKVTFGQAAGISPAVDAQRRANRRWAASFVESIWQQYGVVVESPDRPDPHRVAVGLIGGLFDLIIDFIADDDADPGRSTDADQLVADLTDFYQVVRAGLVRDA